jgi:hypothetical protein
MKKKAHVETPHGFFNVPKKGVIEEGDLELCAVYDHGGASRGWILTWEPLSHHHRGCSVARYRGPIIRRVGK